MTDYTLTAEAGAFTLTGVAAGLIASRVLTAGTGSFVLTGKTVRLAYTSLGDVVPTGRIRVPEYIAGEAEHRRLLARMLNSVADGKLDCVKTVTLTASSATTVVTDARISVWTVVTPMPKTANAAAEIAAGGMYFLPANGSVTIYHANNGQTDRIFGLSLIG